MTDKVLCPWCGAEMEEHLTCASGGYPAWCNYKCPKCSAKSPHEDTRERARTAALRRYTPPIKPMTLEEVIAFDGEIWMEDKSDFDVWACRCFFNRAEKKMTVHYITMNTEVLEFSTYGKTWRCWERKPTDEERSAAEWLKE